MTGDLEARWQLVAPRDAERPIAWRDGAQVTRAQFERHVDAIVASLPAGTAMIDLCEDRYRFLAAYAAALQVGHPVLLPSSRAEQVIAEVQSTNPGSYRFDDAAVDAALSHEGIAASSPLSQGEVARSSARVRVGKMPLTAASARRGVTADQAVMIGFTSGSTGQPKRFPKLWRTVAGSNALNAATIRAMLGIDATVTPWILATVPPQHMYGMELSILLPLAGDMAVHSGRPLFPADIAAALVELPRPRVLVSTPVHLRALAESTQAFPHTELIVSATAPLDRALAAAVEHKLGGTLLEMFGSTETCVFAWRRTAQEDSWRAYEGVQLHPSADGTAVDAPWFVGPVQLQDILELQGGGRFVVRGRNSDMIEVAGKRASLADLTRRLLAIEGVRDAVVFQPDTDAVATIRRVAALVVAPGMTSREILDRLAPSVDAAFMPRPLLLVERLPRNELGKLPRENLLRALHRQ